MKWSFMPGSSAAFIALALVSASGAQAFTVTAVGQSGTSSFDIISSEPDAVSPTGAQLTLTLQQILSGGKSWLFGYSVSNQAPASPITSYRTAGFAFDVEPDVDSGTATGTYTQFTQNGQVPGFGVAENCVSGVNCAAGGNAGPQGTGATGSGTFTLNFTNAQTSLSLFDFVVRYQSIDVIGFSEEGSGIGRPTQGDLNPVPLPAAAWLFISAIGGMIMVGRRRRMVGAAA